MNNNPRPSVAQEFLIAAGVLLRGANLGAAGSFVLVKLIAFVGLSIMLCMCLLGIPIMLFVMLFSGHILRPLFQAAEYGVIAVLCVMALGRLGGRQVLAIRDALSGRGPTPATRDVPFNE